jgi:hypothetical protein
VFIKGAEKMGLSDQEKRLAEAALGRYCDKKISLEVEGKIKLTWKFRGNSVTLFECRPPWRGKTTDPWTEMPIAQFRYDDKMKEWTLYCADRNDRWHDYMDCDPAKSIQTLLEAVDEDPTGIFWG